MEDKEKQMAKNNGGKAQAKDKFSQSGAKVVEITKMGQVPGTRYGMDPNRKTKG